MDNFDVVKKLIGPIEPIGCSNIDSQRFENLKAMTELVGKILIEINIVASYKDRVEHSLNKAGKFASEFLSEIA